MRDGPSCLRGAGRPCIGAGRGRHSGQGGFLGRHGRTELRQRDLREAGRTGPEIFGRRLRISAVSRHAAWGRTEDRPRAPARRYPDVRAGDEQLHAVRAVLRLAEHAVPVRLAGGIPQAGRSDVGPAQRVGGQGERGARPRHRGHRLSAADYGRGPSRPQSRRRPGG